MTNGSRRLRIEYAAETLTPEVRAKAREAMHSEEVRAKLSALRKGRDSTRTRSPPSASWAKRPKSEEWKRGQSERSRKMWENPEAHGLPPRRQWTDEEIALLGTDTDRAIANAIGLAHQCCQRTSASAWVSLAWLSAGRSTRSPCWARPPTANSHARWENHRRPSGESASSSGFPRSSTDGRTRRSPCSEPPVTAKSPAGWGGRATCVQSKREQLGIPAFVVRWTRAEIALLGTDTDRNIARLLGRTEEAVRVRRKKLRIPAYR